MAKVINCGRLEDDAVISTTTGTGTVGGDILPAFTVNEISESETSKLKETALLISIGNSLAIAGILIYLLIT